MKKLSLLFALTILLFHSASSQSSPMDYAFCIAAPSKDRVDDFVKFIDTELGPNDIGTLIVRIDFNYAFESYPNLRDKNPLTKKDVKKLVKVAKKHNINLIPQINLLGHQSWAETTLNLLREYPEFDETPHIKMPEKYTWPNDDGLYCRSYCPLHPEVHTVVFGLVDEIIEVFEARAFHAGMDEVFYIGDNKCPRCGGKDKAELYAGEVSTIRNHLAEKNVKLWIWGDRLINGPESGLGVWEASGNHTEAAIDLIPKDVMINDWHYNNAVPTPAYFATEGFEVYSCFWNSAPVATAHMEMMNVLRQGSPDPIKTRLAGAMQTVWSSADSFMDAYYETGKPNEATPQAESFKAMIEWIKKEK